MIKQLEDGKLVLSNAKYLHVTPWTGNDDITTTNAESEGVTMDFTSIVGDTLSFTPDDNTVNEKPSEFTSAPLFETVTLGKIQFAATCVDLQNNILKEIFGWDVEQASGAAFAPNLYAEQYVTLEVGFADEKVAVVVPKLKLNAKAVISALKTGTAEANLAGTCYPATMTIGESITTDSTQTYYNTPMAFVPVGTEKKNHYLIQVKSKGNSGVTDKQFAHFTVGAGVATAKVAPEK